MKYVELRDVRKWIDLDDDIIDDDAVLTDVITSAELELDQICHRTFTAPGAETAKIYRVDDRTRVYVDDAPSFTTVEQSYDRSSWATVPTSSWWAGPDNEPVKTYVETAGAFTRWLRLTAPWGYTGGPPADLIAALRIRSAALLTRKDSPNGIAGESQFGIARVSVYDDPDVMRLTRRLVRHDRAGIG